MSAVQTMASEQFINAMGPMVADERTMKQVMAYIALLRHQVEPCQVTTDEMHDILASSIADVHAGKGTIHADLKKEIAQWL